MEVLEKKGEQYRLRCVRNHEFLGMARNVTTAETRNRPMRCPICTAERLEKWKHRRPWRTHGMSKKHPAWFRWLRFRQRAKRQGISVCERWLKFENFFDDMGTPPPKMVIDRIDGSKGYSPDNCRWASYKLSTENRRNTVWLTFNGKRYRVTELARIVGVPVHVVYSRLYAGWSVQRIASIPKRRNRNEARSAVAEAESH
jgi:hypothetical protein